VLRISLKKRKEAENFFKDVGSESDPDPHGDPNPTPGFKIVLSF
jgi:hypothetical protein